MQHFPVNYPFSIRLKRSQSTDPDGLEKLIKAGKVIPTPCKNLPGKRSTSYDDRFILQAAELRDGAVISNDNFVDLLKQKDGNIFILFSNSSHAISIELNLSSFLFCTYLSFVSTKHSMGRNHWRTCCWVFMVRRFHYDSRRSVW